MDSSAKPANITHNQGLHLPVQSPRRPDGTGCFYALGGQGQTEDAYALKGMLSILGISSFVKF